MREEPEPLSPQRFSVKFEAPDGTEWDVEIPSEEVERAWKLVEEEDFEELCKYPKVSESHNSTLPIFRLSSRWSRPHANSFYYYTCGILQD